MHDGAIWTGCQAKTTVEATIDVKIWRFVRIYLDDGPDGANFRSSARLANLANLIVDLNRDKTSHY
jgi:hypothetical protein